MVEEFEGCDVQVECLGITQVTNPGVCDYSLDEDFDTGLGRFISLVVLDTGSPGGFHTNTFDARRVIGDVWVIDRQTGSWEYEGKAIVMEVPVWVDDESPA